MRKAFDSQVISVIIITTMIMKPSSSLCAWWSPPSSSSALVDARHLRNRFVSIVARTRSHAKDQGSVSVAGPWSLLLSIVLSCLWFCTLAFNSKKASYIWCYLSPKCPNLACQNPKCQSRDCQNPIWQSPKWQSPKWQSWKWKSAKWPINLSSK